MSVRFFFLPSPTSAVYTLSLHDALPIFDPELDLWDTAKPYLEHWMRQRMGLSGFAERLGQEAGQWSQLLPQLPRLLHERLSRPAYGQDLDQQMRRLAGSMRRTNQLLFLLCLVLIAGLIVLIWPYIQ